MTDNDTAPTVTFSASSQTVDEDDGTITVTVNQSAASGRTTTIPFTISGTAANPADRVA